MQTKVKSNIFNNSYHMTLPDSLKPKINNTGEAIDSMVAAQHPIIGLWLVFSFLSIGVLSVLLYVI